MLCISFGSWHHTYSHLQCSWTGRNILPKQLTRNVCCKTYSPGFTLLPVPPARNLSSCLLSYSCWIQKSHRVICWPSKLVQSKIHDAIGPDFSFPKSSFTSETAPPTTLRVRHVTELWSNKTCQIDADVQLMQHHHLLSQVWTLIWHIYVYLGKCQINIVKHWKCRINIFTYSTFFGSVHHNMDKLSRHAYSTFLVKCRIIYFFDYSQYKRS